MAERPVLHGRVLFLAADPARIDEQLAGTDLAREAAGPLRGDLRAGRFDHPGRGDDQGHQPQLPGRSGTGQVRLASPPTVAARAIAGEIVSFAELQAGWPG